MNARSSNHAWNCAPSVAWKVSTTFLLSSVSYFSSSVKLIVRLHAGILPAFGPLPLFRGRIDFPAIVLYPERFLFFYGLVMYRGLRRWVPVPKVDCPAVESVFGLHEWEGCCLLSILRGCWFWSVESGLQVDVLSSIEWMKGRWMLVYCCSIEDGHLYENCFDCLYVFDWNTESKIFAQSWLYLPACAVELLLVWRLL